MKTDHNATRGIIDIFVSRTRLRGWARVDGYFKEIWWLSVLAVIVAQLIAGNAGRPELYLKIMYSTVVPVYAIRAYIELRGRNKVPHQTLFGKIVITIFVPIWVIVMIITPWWILTTGNDSIGRSHLAYVAMRESIIGLAAFGAMASCVAVLMLYGLFGALPLIWKSTDRR